MDQQRSPRYPSVGLADAIAAARSLWQKEKRTSVNGEVLAKGLGYSSLSGIARSKIGSLRQYGILEPHGNGLRLSDLGMEIVHNTEGSEAYKKAIRSAALNPDLFRDLYTTHPDGSEDAIRSYLILKKGFSDAGARQAAASYRDTLALADLNDSGYTPEQEAESMPEVAKAPEPRTAPPPATGSKAISTPVGTVDGKPVFAHVSFDSELRKEYISSLKKYLEYLEGTLQ